MPWQRKLNENSIDRIFSVELFDQPQQLGFADILRQQELSRMQPDAPRLLGFRLHVNGTCRALADEHHSQARGYIVFGLEKCHVAHSASPKYLGNGLSINWDGIHVELKAIVQWPVGIANQDACEKKSSKRRLTSSAHHISGEIEHASANIFTHDASPLTACGTDLTICDIAIAAALQVASGGAGFARLGRSIGCGCSKSGASWSA